MNKPSLLNHKRPPISPEQISSKSETGKLILKIAKALSSILFIFASIFLIFTIFLIGYVKGFQNGSQSVDSYYKNLPKDNVSATTVPTVTTKPTIIKTQPKITWGGPQLWEAVNKRRVQLGVNPMQVKDEICTIASIRLNQILDLDNLDGHKGFSELPQNRPDLKWIFEKYNLSEFLVSGATSPEEAVSLWENTLGHKELMSGGQYVWGCIYAQNGYGVAIAAY